MREIAEEVGVGKSTVERDLHAPVREYPNLTPGARPAQPGNERALTHGCYAERTLAPVRERHVLALAERYPQFDPGRIATEAQRRAMIELASEWLDGQSTVVRDGEGRTFDIATKLAGWLISSERWIERAELERETTRPRSLEEAIAASGDAWRRFELNGEEASDEGS